MFSRLLCWSGIAAAVLVQAQQPAGQESPARATSAPQDPVQYGAVLQQYCFTCHNERLKTADLDLSGFDVKDPGASAEVWEKVARKLRTGQMPPAGRQRPDAAFYEAFPAYLETALDRAADAKPNPGRPTVHRLNRLEYTNAVRDLLAVDVDAAALLPADDAGRTFDNIAEILSVSPLLVEKYLSAARKISRLAIGERSVHAFTAEYDVSRRLVQDDRMSEDLPFGSRGGLAIQHDFPLDGEYVIKVRLQRNNDNYVKGMGEPHQLDVRLDGSRIKLFSVGGEHKGRSAPVYSFINKDYRGDPEQEAYETIDADAGLEVRFQAKAGTRVVTVNFLKDAYAAEGVFMPPQYYDELLAYKGGEPGVDSVFITGPDNPSGLEQTRSRERILRCQPSGGNEQEELDCAKRTVASLARRAYRRPVTDGEVRTLLRFYEIGRGTGDFESGIRTMLQGLLTSPEFLFRIERDPAGVAPGTPYRVSDLELASRLSFFVWSTVPDEELLAVAERGRLSDAEVLQQQTRRLLGDTRSRILARNFAAQWLGLRRLAHVSPDPTAFPDFDDNLRDAAREETELFAESIASEDRSVLDFLDADYTYLNERLARHYGIPNVHGSSFRRVKLTDGTRGGLLGHASVLTVTSYANRTAPTLRGKWVLDNMLGTPPPPPPPNVPSLKESGEDISSLTMRQRMEQHRVNPTCASCHARMDPLGFALENFDALGRWRTTEAGRPVDASGVLPDGTAFHGPAELRRILVSRREQFVTTLTEKLLTYALGREMDYVDQPAVRRIMREAAPGGYRWSSLVAAVVRSTPFQMRMSQEP
jgi:mono/diheme cytochrome c family protein